MKSEPTAPSFLEHVERIATSRDRDAFAELFNHFAPRVKTWNIRAGCNDATATELAQETLLAVWHHAARYRRERASVSTWVYTLARNKRIDRIRRERRPTVHLDDPCLVRDPDEERHYGWDEIAAEQGRLEERIAALPAEQASVLQRVYVEGKSHGTIAEELGIAVGTVKSRLRLALQSLRVTYSREAA